MLTSGRPGAFGLFVECQAVGATHAHCAATSDQQKRITRLRELAREFRRILKECTVFDGRLPEKLRAVIADLEEEADRLERDPNGSSALPGLSGRTAQWRFGSLPD
jgi:hypothetical protein